MQSQIYKKVKELLREIPQGVTIVAATKTRSTEEIEEAISAGIQVIGENYVQEAKNKYSRIRKDMQWHLIGHLQKNKVKDAVKLFDMIETVDSLKIAQEIDKRCGIIQKVMPILIQVNIGGEDSKSGVSIEDLSSLIEEISHLQWVKVKGLMTIEPYKNDPEESRVYFKQMHLLFEQIDKLHIPNVQMRYLSMGMSHNYHIAIQEGANIIRIGTALFGPRPY